MNPRAPPSPSFSPGFSRYSSAQQEPDGGPIGEKQTSVKPFLPGQAEQNACRRYDARIISCDIVMTQCSQFSIIWVGFISYLVREDTLIRLQITKPANAECLHTVESCYNIGMLSAVTPCCFRFPHRLQDHSAVIHENNYLICEKALNITSHQEQIKERVNSRCLGLSRSCYYSLLSNHYCQR